MLQNKSLPLPLVAGGLYLFSALSKASFARAEIE